MQRGDLLVVIPITGDALNDAGGRVLRLSATTQRETYDADLHRFQEQAEEEFSAWAASLSPHQSRTNILGTLDVARQELAVLPQGINRRLFLVSDFLEDDGTYRFVSATSLANPACSRQFAAHLRGQNGFALQGVTLCLGRLESRDFAGLSPLRQEAVEAFWAAYFAQGDEPAEIHFDGIGMLADAGSACAGGVR